MPLYGILETMNEAYILSAVRTPVGIKGGSLAGFTPEELGSFVLREAMRRAAAPADRVDSILMGTAAPLTGPFQGEDIALLRSGFTDQVPVILFDLFAGSGQQAFHCAAQMILAGDADLVLAGGMQAASSLHGHGREPGSSPDEAGWREAQALGSAVKQAEEWGFSDEKLEAYASQSRLKAFAARAEGRLADQIIPGAQPGSRPIIHDEALQGEPAGPLPGGLGQASDGAAALLLCSPRAVGRLNLVPRARVVARAVVGSPPGPGLAGMSAAARQVLKRAGLEIDEIDVFEIDEAHPPAALAWIKEFQIDLEQVNPNGGTLAYHHPCATAGVIQVVELVHELERRKAQYGLQVVNSGFGLAAAAVIERI